MVVQWPVVVVVMVMVLVLLLHCHAHLQAVAHACCCLADASCACINVPDAILDAFTHTLKCANLRLQDSVVGLGVVMFMTKTRNGTQLKPSHMQRCKCSGMSCSSCVTGAALQKKKRGYTGVFKRLRRNGHLEDQKAANSSAQAALHIIYGRCHQKPNI
jgi:hypothetical protein